MKTRKHITSLVVAGCILIATMASAMPSYNLQVSQSKEQILPPEQPENELQPMDADSIDQTKTITVDRSKIEERIKQLNAQQSSEVDSEKPYCLWLLLITLVFVILKLIITLSRSKKNR